MLQANELRIGNLVEYYDGRFIQVDGNVILALVTVPNYADPIKLTPDIFIKCGFEFDRYAPDYSLIVNRSWVLLFNNEKGFRIADFNDDYYKNGCNVNFLHQLQNLYFALTGEELNIQL